MPIWLRRFGKRATASTHDIAGMEHDGPGFLRVILMPKFEAELASDSRSAFMERRKLRRVRMIVELTHNLISSNMTVSHREARCLVECARKAILELHPAFIERYERIVRPHFERVLTSRWPREQSLEDCTCDDMIN